MTETIVAVRCDKRDCGARALLRLLTNNGPLHFCQHHGVALMNTTPVSAIDKWTMVGAL